MVVGEVESKTQLTVPLECSLCVFAVVYHHGRSAQGGHYTCDVHHPPSGGWLRMDDNHIKPVTEEAVLKPSSQQLQCRVAYLLFYRRMDTVLESRRKF